eukprot:CAMPEP_0119116452 /NCGR_PEP_ID=MMETSP1180-20130426/52291_1 /TAXON_ID=3052 ORGANISM="Chlamydomonas cf sp, Strain CCMP681" /NCGR_SAMPLE_ID=MMETSP1180 /ASSEMBLY_ACC=CAM_ASM_000741 /LENGTH=80 /DNA_ID=CAMNT_0007105601 /DNA_START=1232 /DNA_END=1474 /DNA_ORIENTATION=+
MVIRVHVTNPYQPQLPHTLLSACCTKPALELPQRVLPAVEQHTTALPQTHVHGAHVTVLGGLAPGGAQEGDDARTPLDPC